MSRIKEFFNDNRFIASVLTTFIFLIALCVILLNTILSNKGSYALRIYRDKIELKFEGARAELVDNIDSVIHEVAPTTCLNGLAILRECEKYDVDLFFVLAQGQLESHYGTKGLAQRTNSVFNVFAYDGKSYAQINKNGKYEHPDLSIEPYLKLLREHYLVDGKTETDLMVNYVNNEGKRYASNERYEHDLIDIYNKFIENESLQRVFKEYARYKILSGN